IWIISVSGRFTSKTLSEDFRRKSGVVYLTQPVKRSVVLLGRFLAAYVMCVISIVAVYIIVAALSIYYFGQVSPYLWWSMLVALTTCFAYCSLSMVLNTVFGSQKSLLYLIVFLGIPAFFLLLSMEEIVGMETLQYVFPLSDVINTSLHSSYNGFSLFAFGRDLLSLPRLTISATESAILGMAWGIVLLVAATVLYSRKEI
ncbi:MAG: ABC transporter permease subunit, partial [Thermoplasmata archaeon]|nr:ABC transporter permease subunit [Thermoplasmata archaeon]